MSDSNQARLSPPLEQDVFQRLVEAAQDYAIFVLDPGGNIVSWNVGAQRIKGYAAQEVIGRHFSIFYPEEARRRKWPEHELEIAATQGRFEDEGWRVRKDGTRFWANVVITAMRNAAGELRGFSKITRELTERRASEERLRRSEERFRLLVESVKDYAIFMLDPDGRIVSWNAGAQRISGYAAQEVLGRHFSLLYPEEARRKNWPEQELAAAREQGRFEEEGVRVRKDGSTFWANVLLTPVFDPPGTLHGYAKVTRDLSDLRRIEALEKSGRQTSEFLAMLAHELRNPLAPIANALKLLSRRPSADPTELWVREVLERQTGQMSRLVDDLLDVSRVTRAAMVQRLVNLHDGSVEARSAGPGQGSEFVVRLPLRAEPAIVQPPSTAHAEDCAPPGAPRRVLVVDDNQDAAQALRLLLESEGHEVMLAADGPAGLSMAREHRPDVVLLDIGLPRLNGYEIATRIRADPALKGTMLVAVTGYGQMHDRARASASGFDHHLVKPVEFSALQDLLRASS